MEDHTDSDPRRSYSRDAGTNEYYPNYPLYSDPGQMHYHDRDLPPGGFFESGSNQFTRVGFPDPSLSPVVLSDAASCSSSGSSIIHVDVSHNPY